MKLFNIRIHEDYVWKVDSECKKWGQSNYTWNTEQVGHILITSDKNVVDVITETFINHPHLYEILS